jgi:hypothetical protein
VIQAEQELYRRDNRKMKKKNIEKLAEKRKLHVEAMEIILSKRKKQIQELKEEIEAYKQVTGILEAFIIEGVAKQGEVRIPIKELSEGLKTGYKIDISETEYILKKDS